MRIVVFSDIHGNRYAFDQFIIKLNQMEYDLIIFCGDIFGYYYDQRYIIEKLKKIKNLIWLKGNHDDNAVRVYKGLLSENELIEQYGHSYQNLKKFFNESDINDIETLPVYKELEISGKKVGVFHGTPDDFLMGRLYPDNIIQQKQLYLKYDMVILGHTHFKMVRNLENTMIINPGALGQPRDGKGFGYVVIDFDTSEVWFHNIEFDKKELYKQIDCYDPKLEKLKKILERKDVKFEENISYSDKWKCLEWNIKNIARN